MSHLSKISQLLFIANLFFWIHVFSANFLMAQVTEQKFPSAEVEKSMSMLLVRYSENECSGWPVLPSGLSMLLNPHSDNYLELTTSQQEKIQSLADSSLNEAAEFAKQILDTTERQDFDAKIDKKLAEISEKIDSELYKKILLPHQIEALERYPMYVFIKRNGLFKSLVYTGIGDNLGVRDEQRKKMEETADRLSDKIKKFSIEIEKEIFEEFFVILDSDQKNKIEWLRPIYEPSFDLNLGNKLHQLDRSNLGSCLGCDPSRAILPVAEKDENLKSVLDRK